MKKANNLILLAVLGGLALAFAALKFFRSPGLERTLPARLIEIDSAKVSSLDIRPSRQSSELVQLVRSGKSWELKSGNRAGRLEPGAAASALRALVGMKPQRLVARKSDKWDELGVGTKTGTRVKIMEQNKVLADLWFGKSGMIQDEQGGFRGSYTNVRREGEDEVYAAEGFLEGRFNRSFDDWRDKVLIRLRRDSIDQITFQYPDSGFVLTRLNGKWMAGTQPADSAAVVSYLGMMAYKSLTSFTESGPVGSSQLSVTFEKGAKTAGKVEAWKSESGWTLTSSQQPGTYFTDDGKEIFKGKATFLKKAK